MFCNAVSMSTHGVHFGIQIRVLFEAVVFEPKAFAPKSKSVDAIPLDRSHPNAARQALGTSFGALAFELREHPESVMLPLLTLVRDAANLCIGILGSDEGSGSG